MEKQAQMLQKLALSYGRVSLLYTFCSYRTRLPVQCSVRGAYQDVDVGVGLPVP